LLTGNEWLTISGALLYLSMEVFELILIYRDARLFRAGDWQPNEKKSLIEHLAAWVRGFILYGGMFLMMGLDKETAILGLEIHWS